MLKYFKTFVHHTQSPHKVIQSVLRSSRSHPLCLCANRNQNYSEKQLRFQGVHVTIHTAYENSHLFEADLCDLLNRWKTVDGRRSAYLEVPISQSHLIPIAARHGFTFHHARDDKSVLSIWLDSSSVSRLPLFANHTLGAAGACFNEETNEILMVKDKGRFSNWWKFPGGYSERGEFIGETAVRETFEETGVHSRFESILSIRESHEDSHGDVFGQSNFYVICRLSPISMDINSCTTEIEACDWLKLDDVARMEESTPLVKLVCNLLVKGFESILSFGEMHGGQFDQSSFFFICRLHPLSFTINPCPDEIHSCQWFDLQYVLDDPQTTPFVRRVCQVLTTGMEGTFLDVDIIGQDTKSWMFPNKKFMWYHRAMPSETGM